MRSKRGKGGVSRCITRRKIYLNVGVAIEELNESLEASDVALHAFEQKSRDCVLLCASLVHLVFHVSEDCSHELHDSEDKRTECKRTQVVTERTVQRSAHWCMLLSFLAVTEVPDTRGRLKEEEVREAT